MIRVANYVPEMAIKTKTYISVLLIVLTSFVTPGQSFANVNSIDISKSAFLPMVTKAQNGANIRELKFQNFSYDSKRDLQQITITWKADRGNTFEILATSSGNEPDQKVKNKTGTSATLTVPANGVLRVAMRAEKYPQYHLFFAYESPLQFKYLILSQLRGPCLNVRSNAQDRIQLWEVIKRKNITGRLGLFILVAPFAINATPGTSLTDALSSAIVSNVSEVLGPLDINAFTQGLSALAETKSTEYFLLRCAGK